MPEETDDVAGECPLCYVSLTQGSLDFLHAACRAEVVALRRALEFYADPEQWRTTIVGTVTTSGGWDHRWGQLILRDNGERARAALATRGGDREAHG